MVHIIKNYEELSSRGGEERRVALDLLEEGLRAADPESAVKSNVHLRNGLLRIGGAEIDLSSVQRVVVVGAGKASGSMAKAVEDVLGDLIEDGLVIVPRGSPLFKLKRIRLWEGDHPIPSERGMEGARRILELLKESSGKDTLVIALISGGGSALMPLPAKGISLDDKKELTRLLLRCGASIDEINVVRKHISAIKGGWLAKAAYPSRIISLIISDVVGDRLDLIASGPTVPDPSTFEEAYNILKRYRLEEAAPRSVVDYIKEGIRGSRPETPKPGDPVFDKVLNLIVASNRLSLLAMKAKAEAMGFTSLLLTSYMEGEARHVGKFLASICKEVFYHGSPVGRPAVILAGGETTVTVVGKGKGGRNQELVLGALKGLRGVRGVALASIGSDGIDGVTDAAGAVLDEHFIRRVEERGLEADEFLSENDSYGFFKEVGDGLIYTGYTGTNVNDLTVAVVR